MNDYIEERALEEATYIVKTKGTVRDTAKMFGVCKSTVHIDVTKRLPKINPPLAEQVKKILDFNFSDKHIRGGRTTHLRYRGCVQ